MRNIVGGLAVLLAIALVVGLCVVGWEDVTQTRETERLRMEAQVVQAEADAAKAEADRLRAAGEYERAQGERSLKESTGRAIEAPSLAAARAVDANTGIVTAMGRTNTLYDRLLPLGGLMFVGVLLLAGSGLGAVAVVVVMYLREKKKNDGLKLVASVNNTALDLK